MTFDQIGERAADRLHRLVGRRRVAVAASRAVRAHRDARRRERHPEVGEVRGSGLRLRDVDAEVGEQRRRDLRAEAS